MKIRTKSWIGLAGVLAAALNAHAATGTLSGPVAHDNLQVFLVHGDSQLEQRRYATLSEAIEKGWVVVKETGNVNELSIENLSKEATVFLNAGDIVKGGRQDRTLQDDLVLAPQSGLLPLAAFCVEHGRWTQRGGENAAAFGANSKVLASREMKIASRYGNNQSQVWAGVAEQQARLNENVSRLSGKTVDTRSADSQSSYQLTLENKDLDAVKKRYLDKLSGIMDGKTDVIGFTYAINGEVNSAEVYNNKNLFRALWPKLLDAAVTEAITDYRPGRQFHPATAEDVKGLFETAVSGKVTERSPCKSTRVKTYATPTTLMFETLDLDAGGVWIHKSFINKGTDRVVVPLDSNLNQNRQINAPW